MQLPQLQTGNTDVSNALFRLADDEQRRRAASEQTAMRQLEAENRLIERSILADKQRSIPAEREARNALMVHDSNMRRASAANDAYKYLKSSIRTVKQEDYPTYKKSLESLGIVPGSLPDSFDSTESFNKWKEVTADVIDKSAKGTKFIYERAVNTETGQEVVLPFEEGEIVSLDKYFKPSELKNWKVKVKGEKEPKGYDPVTAEEIIVKNKDDVQLVMPKVREFNEKADVDYIYTTKQKKGINPWSDAKETLTTRKLPVFNGRRLTKQDISDYAKSRKMAFHTALDRFIELENNVMSQPKSSTLKAPSNAVTLDNIGN